MLFSNRFSPHVHLSPPCLNDRRPAW
jgi:hypothetical protein